MLTSSFRLDGVINTRWSIFSYNMGEISIGEDLNNKVGWCHVPCQNQVHRVLSEYMQCVSSSLPPMVHRRAYEGSPLTRPG